MLKFNKMGIGYVFDRNMIFTNPGSNENIVNNSVDE